MTRRIALALILTAATGLRADERFDRLTPEMGLSHSVVWAVAQDARGFLWFGTNDGLSRFDGLDVKVFRIDAADPTSLSDNYVNSVWVDDSGSLWAATRGGLNRYIEATESFERFLYDPEDPNSICDHIVWDVLADHSGTLWAATDNGLAQQVESGFRCYRYDEADPSSIASNKTLRLFLDSQGLLWLVTTAGVDRIDPATGKVVLRLRHDPNDPKTIAAKSPEDMAEDSKGRIWFVSSGGIDLFDLSTQLLRRFPGEVGRRSIRTIFFDTHDEAWLGTASEGLLRIDPSQGFIEREFRYDPSNANSLNNDRVNAVIEDRTGLIWVGTPQGVARYVPSRERLHVLSTSSTEIQLPGDAISSVLEDQDGKLWAAAQGQALARVDLARRTVTSYQRGPKESGNLPSATIRALLQDRAGVLWVGTGEGLSRFDAESGTFETFSRDDTNSTSHNVQGLFEDSNGRLWIPSAEGLYVFDAERKNLDAFEGAAGTENVWFTTVAEDRTGRLWVGARVEGLFSIDTNPAAQLVREPTDPADPASLSSPRIHTLVTSRDGALWVGTADGGVNRRDPVSGEFERFRVSDGLPSNTVVSIAEDDEGLMWLGTYAGLVRLNPRSGEILVLDRADGLPATEFKARAVYRSFRSGGRMYFGSSGGVVFFSPVEVQGDPYAPPVVFTELRLANQPVKPGPDAIIQSSIVTTPEIFLRYNQDDFSVRFAALHYVEPSRNGYRYKLEGYKDDWLLTDAEDRTARYTNLNPGTYTLRVKADNGHGVETPEPAALRIHVAPAPWKSMWAYAFYVAAGIGVIGLLFGLERLKLQRQKALAAQQEQMVVERTAQLREALAEVEARNTELEAFSRTVSHDLKSPLITMRGFLEFLRKDIATGNVKAMESDFERLEGAITKMSRLIEDLLRLSKAGRQVGSSESVAFRNLVEEVAELLSGPMTDRGIELIIAKDLPVVEGDPARLRQVAQNLLANAVKFSGDNPVVEVGWMPGMEGRVTLFVRDNGIGIAKEDQEKVFELFERLDPDADGSGIGLSLVRRIVEAHGGRAWAESKGEGHGSTFYFTLPRAKSNP